MGLINFLKNKFSRKKKEEPVVEEVIKDETLKNTETAEILEKNLSSAEFLNESIKTLEEPKKEEKNTKIAAEPQDFSKKEDAIQTTIIALLAFLVPTFLARILSGVFGAQSVIATNSQLIVGSIVNTALVISAINLKGWKKKG